MIFETFLRPLSNFKLQFKAVGFLRGIKFLCENAFVNCRRGKTGKKRSGSNLFKAPEKLTSYERRKLVPA